MLKRALVVWTPCSGDSQVMPATQTSLQTSNALSAVVFDSFCGDVLGGQVHEFEITPAAKKWKGPRQRGQVSPTAARHIVT